MVLARDCVATIFWQKLRIGNKKKQQKNKTKQKHIQSQSSFCQREVYIPRTYNIETTNQFVILLLHTCAFDDELNLSHLENYKKNTQEHFNYPDIVRQLCTENILK